MNQRIAIAVGAALVVALAGGCRQDERREVVVYTSIDQVFSEPILREYERRSGVTVRAVFDTEETKSTGVLNRIVAEARSPRADVFWSGDPIRPLLLVERGLAVRYASPAAANVPGGFKAGDGAWTGGAARARVLLVNTREVARSEMPRSVRDLANPRWKGRTAIANPLYGTTTMHVAALATAWGDDALYGFLAELRRNGVRTASSNGEVKRLVAGGEVAFGLTDTDDAAEALASGAPVEVVYPDQDGLGTLVMPTSVLLLRGPRPEEGRRLVDFLVSADAERALAGAAGHVPIRPGAPPSPAWPGELRPMRVDYASVADAMERLQPRLREWVGL